MAKALPECLRYEVITNIVLMEIHNRLAELKGRKASNAPRFKWWVSEDGNLTFRLLNS